jgi:hypothetical protein
VVLIVEGPGRSWAWTGMRVAPAIGLEATGAYSDVPEQDRRAAAVLAEGAWLRSQREGSVVAVRFVNSRLDGLLDAYVLHRADDPSAAPGPAPPRHVRSLILATDAEVTSALRPFEIHPSGLAELRKTITAARCTRPDTGRGVCISISPFRPGPTSWEPLWSALADLPFRAMITVTLVPHRVDPRLSAGITRLADEYAHLAAPGRSATALYDKPYAPDQFAVHAAPMYAEAARRYVGDVFTYGVSIAAEQELPPTLAATVAAHIPGSTVVRPESLEAAWGNATLLNMDPVETTTIQGIPAEAVGPLERTISGIVDADEAAAMVRMPFQIPGHVELFRGFADPDPGPAAGRQDAPHPDDIDPWLSQRRFG